MRLFVCVLSVVFLGAEAGAGVVGQWTVYRAVCSDGISNTECLSKSPNLVEIRKNANGSVTFSRDGSVELLENFGNTNYVGVGADWSYVLLDNSSIRFESYETDDSFLSNNSWIFGSNFGKQGNFLLLVIGVSKEFPVARSESLTLYLKR